MRWARRRLGRNIASLVVLLAKAALAAVVVAVVAWLALYSVRRVFPIASLDPTKVYDTVLEIKRDWPAFEKQIPESDRENHRELLAFMEATDTGVLVIVALAFDFMVIIIVLQLYLIVLILLLFMWYLLDGPLGAMEERIA